MATPACFQIVQEDTLVELFIPLERNYGEVQVLIVRTEPTGV